MAKKRSKTDAKDFEHARKRREALQLRIAGLSYREMEARLGIPKSTLQDWISGELAEVTREPAEQVHQMELERLDHLMSRMWPRAMGVNEAGKYRAEAVDLEAVDRVLVIMRDRRKMLGVDGPLKDGANKTPGSHVADALLERLAGLVAGAATPEETS